jgi:hypothetical protein
MLWFTRGLSHMDLENDVLEMRARGTGLAGVCHLTFLCGENWSIYCIFCRETKWYHESRNNHRLFFPAPNVLGLFMCAMKHVVQVCLSDEYASSSYSLDV